MWKRRSKIYGDDVETIREHGAFDSVDGQRRLYWIITLTMASAEGIVSRHHLPLNPVRRWRKGLDDVAEAQARGTEMSRSEHDLRDAETNLDGFLGEVVERYAIVDKFHAWQTFTDDEKEKFIALVV